MILAIEYSQEAVDKLRTLGFTRSSGYSIPEDEVVSIHFSDQAKKYVFLDTPSGLPYVNLNCLEAVLLLSPSYESTKEFLPILEELNQC